MRYLKEFALGALLFLLVGCELEVPGGNVPLASGDVTLSWPANGEADLAGYIVYYGTDPNNPTKSFDAGNITNVTKNATNLGLAAGETYYFSIQAYDTSHNLSQRSFASSAIQVL